MKETKAGRAHISSADHTSCYSLYDDCKGQCGYATHCSECQRLRKKRYQQSFEARHCRDEDDTVHQES